MLFLSYPVFLLSTLRCNTKQKKSLSKQPNMKQIEITLEIETGNLIYREFDNKEDLLGFIKEYTQNPARIRELISPKKRAKKIGEQSASYDVKNNDDDDW
jgi:hypothetical protein